MQSKYRTAFVGGLIGAVAVFAALALLVLIGLIPKAPFVGAYNSTFGASGWIAGTVIGGALFILIGALWAVPFPALFSDPTVGKGILWGIVPTLWNWTFVPAVLTGGALFGGGTAPGLIIPIILNCLIWGSIVGWYCRGTVATGARRTGHVG